MPCDDPAMQSFLVDYHGQNVIIKPHSNRGGISDYYFVQQRYIEEGKRQFPQWDGGQGRNLLAKLRDKVRMVRFYHDDTTQRDELENLRCIQDNRWWDLEQHRLFGQIMLTDEMSKPSKRKWLTKAAYRGGFLSEFIKDLSSTKFQNLGNMESFNQDRYHVGRLNQRGEQKLPLRVPAPGMISFAFHVFSQILEILLTLHSEKKGSDGQTYFTPHGDLTTDMFMLDTNNCDHDVFPNVVLVDYRVPYDRPDDEARSGKCGVSGKSAVARMDSDVDFLSQVFHALAHRWRPHNKYAPHTQRRSGDKCCQCSYAATDNWIATDKDSVFLEIMQKTDPEESTKRASDLASLLIPSIQQRDRVFLFENKPEFPTEWSEFPSDLEIGAIVQGWRPYPIASSVHPHDEEYGGVDAESITAQVSEEPPEPKSPVTRPYGQLFIKESPRLTRWRAKTPRGHSTEPTPPPLLPEVPSPQPYKERRYAPGGTLAMTDEQFDEIEELLFELVSLSFQLPTEEREDVQKILKAMDSHKLTEVVQGLKAKKGVNLTAEEAAVHLQRLLEIRSNLLNPVSPDSMKRLKDLVRSRVPVGSGGAAGHGSATGNPHPSQTPAQPPQGVTGPATQSRTSSKRKRQETGAPGDGNQSASPSRQTRSGTGQAAALGDPTATTSEDGGDAPEPGEQSPSKKRRRDAGSVSTSRSSEATTIDPEVATNDPHVLESIEGPTHEGVSTGQGQATGSGGPASTTTTANPGGATTRTGRAGAGARGRGRGAGATGQRARSGTANRRGGGGRDVTPVSPGTMNAGRVTRSRTRGGEQ